MDAVHRSPDVGEVGKGQTSHLREASNCVSDRRPALRIIGLGYRSFLQRRRRREDDPRAGPRHRIDEPGVICCEVAAREITMRIVHADGDHHHGGALGRIETAGGPDEVRILPRIAAGDAGIDDRMAADGGRQLGALADRIADEDDGAARLGLAQHRHAAAADAASAADIVARMRLPRRMAMK